MIFTPVSSVLDKIKMEIFTGVVTADSVWSDTHVSGSGFGLAIGGVGAASQTTRSTIVTNREVCIARDDGRQIIQRFNANKVKMAYGQTISLILATKGQRDPIVLAVYNHGTRKFQRVAGVLGLFPSHLALLIGAAVVTPFALLLLNVAPMSGLIFLAGNAVFLRTAAFSQRLSAIVVEAESMIERGQFNHTFGPGKTISPASAPAAFGNLRIASQERLTRF